MAVKVERWSIGQLESAPLGDDSGDIAIGFLWKGGDGVERIMGFELSAQQAAEIYAEFAQAMVGSFSTGSMEDDDPIIPLHHS